MKKNKFEFIIDSEFQSQIPALTDEEFQQLEENILSEGEVLSPLIVWGNILVDGHNRYNQRNKNNLEDSHLIKTAAAPLTFGEYHNVFLTEKEYKQLKADFSGLDSLIEQLSAYIQSTGKKYANHAATLRIWAKRQKTERKSTPGIPDYTFKEGESL